MQRDFVQYVFTPIIDSRNDQSYHNLWIITNFDFEQPSQHFEKLLRCMTVVRLKAQASYYSYQDPVKLLELLDKFCRNLALYSDGPLARVLHHNHFACAGFLFKSQKPKNFSHLKNLFHKQNVL